MAWSEQKIQTLRDLWSQGVTASKIAEALGDVTRNAVIGKAHRLGLEERESPIKGERKTAAAAPSNVVTMNKHTCMWPVGDPRDKNFHFCGKAAEPGKPYCAEHAALAYTRPSKPEKDLARSAKRFAYA